MRKKSNTAIALALAAIMALIPAADSIAAGTVDENGGLIVETEEISTEEESATEGVTEKEDTADGETESDEERTPTEYASDEESVSSETTIEEESTLTESTTEERAVEEITAEVETVVEETTTEEETATEEITTEEETATEETTDFSAECYLEYMAGMPQDYALTKAEISDKRSLAAFDDFWGMEEGVDYVAGEVLISVDNTTKLNMVAHAYGAEIEEQETGFAVLKLDDGISVADAIAVASGDNNMPVVWPNYYRHYDGLDESEFTGYNDPFLNADNTYYQWQHSNIGSSAAWRNGYKGQGVKVGLLDSGVNENHVDLKGRIKGKYDVKTGGSDVTDTNGHGTHVTGIVAAIANNKKYGCGIAPEADIYMIKLTDLTDDEILRGINKAIEWKMDLVNMSFSGPGYTRVYDAAFDRGLEQGTIFFASAGNDYANCKNIPSCNEQVICVGATDQNNQRTSFSTFGPWVDFAAPGISITSTGMGGGFMRMSGTSVSCPIVLGEAAVILSANKDILNDRSGTRRSKLINKLKKGAVSAGPDMGAGVISLPKVLGIKTASETPKVPEFSVKSGTYNEKSITIKISSKSDDGYRIYYTTNGKKPVFKNGLADENTKLYTGSIEINGQSKTTVKAIAVNAAGVCSKVASATYQLVPDVSSIAVTGGSGTIAIGGSTTFCAVVTPDYAKNKKVQWSISPSGKGVTISSSGKVSAKKNATAGIYTIAAKSQSNSAIMGTVKITVSDKVDVIKTVKFKTAKFTKILKNQNATINLGQELIASKQSGANATATDFIWTVSDKNFASVNANGVVTVFAAPNKDATIKVTAVSNDGKNKKAVATITVKRAIKSMTMKNVMVAPGKSVSVAPVISPVKVANKKFTYTITPQDANVSVGNNGKVTVKAAATPGKKYTITAVTTDGFETKQSCTITVTKALISKIKFEQKKQMIYRVSVGKSNNSNQFKLNVSVKLSDGSDAQAGSYVFTSSNPGIVTVDANGLVKATGNATGNAIITCMAVDGSGKKASCTVTVNNPAARIKISPSAGSGGRVAVGKSIKLIANLDSSYGKINTNDIKWSSNREDVTVTNGVVKAAKNATIGKAVITAATNNGTLKTSYTVRVTKDSGGFILTRNGNLLIVKAKNGCFEKINGNTPEWQIAEDITVSSSDPDVASAGYLLYYAEDGVVQSIVFKVYYYKVGNATITVKANDGTGTKASYELNVTEDMLIKK